jgi:hypothetical protein
VIRAIGLASLLIALSVFGCRAPASATDLRRSGSRAVMPSELFPDDLDLVVRIDAARIRQNPMLAGVVRDLAAKSSTAGIIASAKNAFGDAAAVWVGTRWMSDGFHGDGIVAVESPPSGDARPTETIARPRIEVLERPASSRGEPALEVIVQRGGVVLATAAEADAVLRVLRAGPDAGRLDPPARGLLSFAGRIRGGVALHVTLAAPLRELTDGLIGYAGSLEERDGIEVDASLTYATAARAAAAAEAATRAKKRLGALGEKAKTVADSVKLTEVGSSLQVRASVPFAWLAELH